MASAYLLLTSSFFIKVKSAYKKEKKKNERSVPGNLEYDFMWKKLISIPKTVVKFLWVFRKREAAFSFNVIHISKKNCSLNALYKITVKWKKKKPWDTNSKYFFLSLHICCWYWFFSHGHKLYAAFLRCFHSCPDLC